MKRVFNASNIASTNACFFCSRFRDYGLVLNAYINGMAVIMRQPGS
jgi:hypothetical protein